VLGLRRRCAAARLLDKEPGTGVAAALSRALRFSAGKRPTLIRGYVQRDALRIASSAVAGLVTLTRLATFTPSGKSLV
jgi:hypothetical protein